MAVFRQFTGAYSDGQRVTPAEYFDYAEKIGSSVARQPDGVGGPFVYNFKFGADVSVGSLGWVQSSARKRNGTWQLWGLLSEGRPLPATALAVLWRYLKRREDLDDLLVKANAIGETLWQSEEIPRLLADFRRDVPKDPQPLKSYLRYLYSVYQPHAQSTELPLSTDELELVPWIVLFGPIDPMHAQVLPRPFYDAKGYYCVLKSADTRSDQIRSNQVVSPLIRKKIDEVLAVAESDVAAAWGEACQLRALTSRALADERRLSADADSDRPARHDGPRSRQAVSTEPVPFFDRPLEDFVSPVSQSASEAEAVPVEAKPTDKSWKVRAWARRAMASMRRMVFALIVLALGLLTVGLVLMFLIQRDLQSQIDGLSADIKTLQRTRNVVPTPRRAVDPAKDNVGAVDPAKNNADTTALANRLATKQPAGIRLTQPLQRELAGGLIPRQKLGDTAVQIFARQKGCISKARYVDGIIDDRRAYLSKCGALQAEGLVDAAGQTNTDAALNWLNGQIP